MQHKETGISYEPLYGIQEAARYVRANPKVLRTWVLGAESRRLPPVLTPAGLHDAEKLSFINLIEAHMLVALRLTHRISMQKIRTAVEWLKKETGSQHPLAECQIETDGIAVFVRHLGMLISADEKGQICIQSIIEQFLKRIERDENGLPIFFYPFTRGLAEDCPKGIVITPTICHGRPIISGTRIATKELIERFYAGDSFSVLADGYDLSPELIEEALRCEKEARKAA